MEQCGSEAVIQPRSAVEGEYAVRESQEQGLQQIGFAGTVRANQHREPAGPQVNRFEGTEAGNMNLLDAVLLVFRTRSRLRRSQRAISGAIRLALLPTTVRWPDCDANAPWP